MFFRKYALPACMKDAVMYRSSYTNNPITNSNKIYFLRKWIFVFSFKPLYQGDLHTEYAVQQFYFEISMMGCGKRSKFRCTEQVSFHELYALDAEMCYLHS